MVYNANDPDSRSLAQYYAVRRHIPSDRVFSLSTPLTEEITRADYENTIRGPLIAHFCEKNWLTRQDTQLQLGNRTLGLLTATRNEIWAIVLMRGIPLKIAPDPSEESSMEDLPVFQTNAAAVDSELALLPVFGLPKGGFVANPFFDSQAAGLHHPNAEWARQLILVTRLDGPTPADVRRMIDDSIYAERHRLAGLAVIDARGIADAASSYGSGDEWLRHSRDALLAEGWKVQFDNLPDVLPSTDPCNQVAFYLGWYTDHATGPWVTPPNRFVPGAIAYHLYSFSAATVRSDKENWVGPMISRGADATMGAVYEPYLGLTPHLDIFTRRLLQGDYFAEAAYASEPGLSWMITVVGDPLYRPFRQPIDAALAEDAARGKQTDHDAWLRLQQAQQQLLAQGQADNADALRQTLDGPSARAITDEALGDRLQELKQDGADQAYKKAIARVSLPIDRIRVGLKLARYYADHDQILRAQTETELLRDLYPVDSVTFGVPQPKNPSPSMADGMNPPSRKDAPTNPPQPPAPPRATIAP